MSRDVLISRRRFRAPAFWLSAILALAMIGPAAGQTADRIDALSSRERKTLYGVIAGYLGAFTNNVRWPETALSAGGPFRIGVLGRDPFGPQLDETLRGKTAAGRPLRVERAARAEDLLGCEIVFMDRPSAEEVARAARAIGDRPILLIAFETGGASAATVDLVLQKQGTVRYKLAVSGLRRAGLAPSDGLLQSALRGDRSEEATASPRP